MSLLFCQRILNTNCNWQSYNYNKSNVYSFVKIFFYLALLKDKYNETITKQKRKMNT